MGEPLGTVVVTGASRGIGLGIAAALAEAGHRVVGVARSEGDGWRAAADRAAAAGKGDMRFAAFDLTQLDGIGALFARLRKEHGPIHGLVNNAGVSHAGVLGNTTIADMERVVRFNTLTPMVVAKHAARAMMAAGAGRIVNISSIVASTGYSGLSVYSATKASMLGFTRSLARELGPLGVTVNAVAPGFVQTDMTSEMSDGDRQRVARRSALKRNIDVADVAAAVVFLMGDGGRNVTGAVLTVDAGNTA
jgi:3-oxoacyl-[acyl-carrier protein] reductase